MGMAFSVALGGAIGALSRYGLMSLVATPFGTIMVNVIGSFILGSFLEINALNLSVSEEIRALIVIGFCGALTTFSTFSMDAVYLLQRGEIRGALLYMIFSVILSVLSFAAGMWIFKQILTG